VKTWSARGARAVIGAAVGRALFGDGLLLVRQALARIGAGLVFLLVAGARLLAAADAADGLSPV